jgi:hypothetical protein
VRVAIHQPNFVPWLPFFHKMKSVDMFVILTQCQFARDYYQHRFKFQDRWYTMSIENPKHFQPISTRIYADPVHDWEKIKRRLPQYTKFFDSLDSFVDESLLQMNFGIIFDLAKRLNIATEIVLDPLTQLTGTERLVEICQSVGANTYVAGRGGSRTYLEVEKFTKAGIAVDWQADASDTRHVFEVL